MGAVDQGLCRERGCVVGIWKQDLCLHHYHELREQDLFHLALAKQPGSPHDLPVKPRRWESNGKTWSVVVSLPMSHEGQPCREHPEDFFPDDRENSHSIVAKFARAKGSCLGCPDRVPCMEYGLAHSPDHGIWGGTTPKERREILRWRGQQPVELHTAFVERLVMGDGS